MARDAGRQFRIGIKPASGSPPLPGLTADRTGLIRLRMSVDFTTPFAWFGALTSPPEIKQYTNVHESFISMTVTLIIALRLHN